MATEYSSRRYIRQVLIGAVTIAVIALSFSQLSLRTQGRIVEFCTLGEWPLEWAVRKQFESKQPELSSIVEFIKEVPEFDELTISSHGSRSSHERNFPEGYDLDDRNILQAIVSIEAQFVKVSREKLAVHLGSEIRGPTSFEVSYVYPFRPYEIPSCDSHANDRTEKIGGCSFRLNADWHAEYTWYPVDINELNRSLDSLR